MNASASLQTAILFIFFALWGGVYGICYCIARLRRNRSILTGAYATYALQCSTALALAASTSLAIHWKVAVVLACAASVSLPVVAWRYLAVLQDRANANRRAR